METIETIIEWHKETFPDTTLEEQFRKFELEKKEFLKAKSTIDGLKEIADMYIVACGFSRFNEPISKLLFKKVNSACLLIDVIDEELQKAIDEKMAINRKRKWHKVNGEWRHIDESV